MKWILLLCLLFSSVSFATESRLSALSQPISGSFYIPDNRNVLRNPALIDEVPNQISYDVGAQDLLFFNNSLVLGAGNLKAQTSSLLIGYQFSDMIGLSGYATIEEGSVFDGGGISLGGKFGAPEWYMSFDKVLGVESLTGGIVLPFDAITLFSQYKDELNSPMYDFILGAAYEWALKGKVLPFADLTFNKIKDGKSLTLTAGLSVDLLKTLVGMLSLRHSFLFARESSVAGGVDWVPIDNFVVGASIAISPIVHDGHITHEDLDTKLSISYVF